MFPSLAPGEVRLLSPDLLEVNGDWSTCSPKQQDVTRPRLLTMFSAAQGSG